MSILTTTIENQNGFMIIRSLEDALKVADTFAKSSLVPKEYQNKPGDVLVAMQMGYELGLQPLQAIQNISVINGRPAVWGDAMLAICTTKHDFVDCIETFDDKDMKATCTIKIKNRADVVRTFSRHDAEIAGLFNSNKDNWKKYPRRMLQLRARGFALRDAFPHHLKGIITAEEALDFDVIETKNDVEKVEDNIKNSTPQSQTILKNIKLKTKPKEADVEVVKEEIKEVNVAAKNSEMKMQFIEEINSMLKNKSELQDFINKCLVKANADTLNDLTSDQLIAMIEKMEGQDGKS